MKRIFNLVLCSFFLYLALLGQAAQAQGGDETPASVGLTPTLHFTHLTAGNFWFVGGGLTGLNRFNPTTQTYTRYVSDPKDPTTFQGGGI